MNKAFEKILERLEELQNYACFPTEWVNEEQSKIHSYYANKLTEILKLTEQYSNGWIPCSERLPECGIKVLVQYGCGRINIEECKKNTDGIIGFYDGNYWSNADNYISWQPLPEPYKERDSD